MSPSHLSFRSSKYQKMIPGSLKTRLHLTCKIRRWEASRKKKEYSQKAGLGEWKMKTARYVRMVAVLDEVRDEVGRALSTKIMKIFVNF